MKILIADDETRIISMLHKYLKIKGIAADSAADGNETMRMLNETHYDILFLDINMPGPTGTEILSHIKKNKIDTIVVVLTGYPCVDKNFTESLGADEYLEKPVELEAIEAIIKKYKRK
jgi:DNA-binding response OmpR family regulator